MCGRYPDDPLDRIWESDLVRTDSSYIAPGTKRISTAKQVFVGIQEEPPTKVMQTAVVGESGYLNYRIDLEESIQNAWLFAYFAEIGDLDPNDTRSFRWEVLGTTLYHGAFIDPTFKAQGQCRLYELELKTLSFNRILYLGSTKTNGSSKGPMMNALEVYNYIHIAAESKDDLHTIVIACAVSGAILLAVIAIGCCYLIARRRNASNELGLSDAATTRFKLSEIEDATNKFDRTIGSGGTATVYHGKLADGRENRSQTSTRQLLSGQEGFFEGDRISFQDSPSKLGGFPWLLPGS